MSVERDPNLLIASWLDEGPMELPPDTRRAIETAARTMPQRRRGFGRSWRLPAMNGLLRPAALVAVFLISLIGAVGFGAFRGSSGGPLATATATPTATPSPTTAPSPTPQPLLGRLAYVRTDAETGFYGTFLGVYTSNADGTGAKEFDLPGEHDGAYWSPDGSKLLLANSDPRGGSGFRPAIVNADGSGYRRLETPGSFGDMYCSAWSPDGSRVLCGIADAKDPTVAGIITIDAATGTDIVRISSGAYPGVKGTTSECGGGDSPGAYSPDGTKVVFVRHRCGKKPDPVKGEAAAIYIANADGSGEPSQIVAMGQINSGEPQVSWSPDGQWLLFSNGALYIAHPDGTAYRNIIVDIPMGSYLYSPTWSPDGTRIAFSAWIPGGKTDLWTTTADGNDARPLTNDVFSEDLVSWGPVAP
jgi:Tol biopolymer transport system component